MLCSILPMDTANISKLKDFRQIAICIHHIKYNEILYSLWTVYLKSGLGELQSQHQPQNPLNPSVWPIPIKSRMKNSVRQGINEHNACLVYVQNRLLELEKGIQQSQINLQNQIKRRPDYSSSNIAQAIEKFVENKLSNVRDKIQHKIQLVHYDYKERILEEQYLQHNPTEAQVR